MRACSVVRSPPRASSTASAVPNDPAPITVARFAPGVGSERARARHGLLGSRVVTGCAGMTAPDAPGVAVGSGSVI